LSDSESLGFITLEMKHAFSLLHLNDLELLKEEMRKTGDLDNPWFSDWFDMLEYRSEEQRYELLGFAKVFNEEYAGKVLSKNDRTVIWHEQLRNSEEWDKVIAEAEKKDREKNYPQISKGAPWEDSQKWDRKIRLRKLSVSILTGIAIASFVYSVFHSL